MLGGSTRRDLITGVLAVLLLTTGLAGCLGTTDDAGGGDEPLAETSADEASTSTSDGDEPTNASSLPAPIRLDACTTQRAVFALPANEAPSLPSGFEPVPYADEPTGDTIQLVTHARACQHQGDEVVELLGTIPVDPPESYEAGPVDSYAVLLGGFASNGSILAFYQAAGLTDIVESEVTLELSELAEGAEVGEAHAPGDGFEVSVRTAAGGSASSSAPGVERVFGTQAGAVTGAVDLGSSDRQVTGPGGATINLVETFLPVDGELAGEGVHVRGLDLGLTPVQDLPGVGEDTGTPVDVPVDVILVGFEPGTGDELETALEDETVEHVVGNADRDFLLDEEDETAHDPRIPLRPTVRYDVHQVDRSTADAFFADVASQEIEDREGIYDANAAEQRLGELVADEDGIELDANTPALVLLHADGRLAEDHAWRLTYPNGHLEPVRAFGERLPLLAFDVSAQPDPYVTQRASDDTTYNQPLDPGGEETVAALGDLVEDATHHRLLKGSIYPPATRGCHDVTVLLAVHQTALTEIAPGYRDAEAWVDPAQLEPAFENATGDPVQVHLETVMLPQDDPVLDATSRRAAGSATGPIVFMDAMRWYLDENWETYVESSEGCAEYLSVMLYADESSDLFRQFGGRGMYDVQTDRRISLSVVGDLYRVYNDPGGAPSTAAQDGLGLQSPAAGDEAAESEPDAVNYLLAHETGHLLGLHHPQHGFDMEEGFLYNPAFESVWTTMNYQADDENLDFGAVDRSQLERNKAGYALHEARELGLEDAEAYEAATDAVEANDWRRAFDLLEGELEQARQGSASETALPGFHVIGTHQHPR